MVEPVERRRTEEEEKVRLWAVEGREGDFEKGAEEKSDPAAVEGPEKGFERVREERSEVGGLLSAALSAAAEEARAERDSEAEG